MNTWNIKTAEQVDKFLEKLSIGQQAKVKSIFLLFKEYGTTLPTKYLKKMSGREELWELRAKNVRIFIFMHENTGIAVHGIVKRTQKTPKADLDLAVKRIKEVKQILYEKEN